MMANRRKLNKEDKGDVELLREPLLPLQDAQTAPSLTNGLSVPSTPPSRNGRMGSTPPPLSNFLKPPRSPLHQNSEDIYQPPPSAGSYRTNFESPPSPSGTAFPGSPLTSSFSPNGNSVGNGRLPSNLNGRPSHVRVPSAHRRAPSISFTPSPPVSRTTPYAQSPSTPTFSGGGLSSQQSRHGRIHSRNLSVFFPRPGGEQPSSIAEVDNDDEDNGGVQEVEVRSDGDPSRESAPRVARQRLGDGFKFGGQPASSSLIASSSLPIMGNTKRRGHHHKHSLSHNFFSFMEPGGAGPSAAPTSTPGSPWNPMSPFPSSPSISRHQLNVPDDDSDAVPLPQTLADPVVADPNYTPSVKDREKLVALTFFSFEFLVGACTWAAGQSRGSLACTGLGYWVVFDAFGVALSSAPVTQMLFKSSKGLNRPFGYVGLNDLL